MGLKIGSAGFFRAFRTRHIPSKAPIITIPPPTPPTIAAIGFLKLVLGVVDDAAVEAGLEKGVEGTTLDSILVGDVVLELINRARVTLKASLVY